MTALEQAQLLADRRHAQHELRGWLGMPSRLAHRRADQLIDRINQVEVDLVTQDVVLRWR